MTTTTAASRLCLACGMCCNGVLFRDVELQPGDDADALKKLGLPVRSVRRGDGAIAKAPQPCAALCEDNRCRIYEDRPTRCRQFECLLFTAVISGEVEVDAAMKTIRQARTRADKVLRLLRQSGDAEEHRPLSQRFNRTRRRFESGGFDDDAVEAFADLTLAVHSLNLLLSAKFYSGD